MFFLYLLEIPTLVHPHQAPGVEELTLNCSLQWVNHPQNNIHYFEQIRVFLGGTGRGRMGKACGGEDGQLGGMPDNLAEDPTA